MDGHQYTLRFDGISADGRRLLREQLTDRFFPRREPVTSALNARARVALKQRQQCFHACYPGLRHAEDVHGRLVLSEVWRAIYINIQVQCASCHY